MSLWSKLFGKKDSAPSPSRSTGSVAVLEVFGRGAAPSVSAARQVCDAWVKQNPGADPSHARVRVNVDTSGLWTDQYARAHYPLLHYRGQESTWEFIRIGDQEYWLLVVFA